MFPATSDPTTSPRTTTATGSNETWIHRAVRTVALRQLTFAGLLLAGTLVGWTIFLPYWISFFRGPVEATTEELLGTGSSPVSAEKYLSVHGDKTFDTGMTQITTHTTNGVETSRETSAYYYLLRINDAPLLVKGKRIDTAAQGRLVPIPDDLKSDLFSGSSGRLQSALMPRMLDASENFRENGYWAIGCSIGAVGLAALFARRALQRIGEPGTHPAVQWMHTMPDPAAAAADVERELAHAVRYKKASNTLTQNYVVRRFFFSFRVYALDDLLWCYKQIIQRRVNFIPAGKSHVLKMIFRTGSLDMEAAGGDVDNLVGSIATARPWALYGYSPELAKLAADKTALTAVVNERRQPRLPGA